MSIETLRRAARRRLPRFVFDFLDGGADDEVTIRRNRDAFEQIDLVPRAFCDVSRRDVSAEFLGVKSKLPLAIAPTGLAGAFWPDGELHLARAAKEAGVPFSLSTGASVALEDVAKVGGRLWFQLYQYKNVPGLTEGLLQRAERAGYEALIVTADVALPANRERDRRNGFSAPIRFTPSLIVDGVMHPRWAMQILRHGIPQTVHVPGPVGMDAAITWDSVARLRDLWPRRMLIKGVLSPKDAEIAMARGFDGVIVSNHGGRQFDGAPPSIAALPGVVSAVRGKIEVLVDSGFRRGTDVLKGLALGAKAVMIGRPTLYGLGAGGQEGAAMALRIFRDEIRRGMGLCGANSIADFLMLHATLHCRSPLQGMRVMEGSS